MGIIGHDETFSEHGFQVSGVRPTLAFSLLTPYMKPHHLLQKCSFFLIKLAAFLVSGAARMKLHEIQCRFHEFY